MAVPYWRSKDIGFRGFWYPFQLDSRGAVMLNDTAIDDGIVDSIAQAIDQLIHTRVGSRFFNRSFGAAPVDLIFRRNLPEEMYLWASEIQDILRMWEPRVAMTEFEITDQFDSTAIIRLGFQVRQTQLHGFVEAAIPMEG
jgi:phage baseplate assembly protein W